MVITFYNTELTSCQLAQNIYMRNIKIIILSQLLIWWPTLSLNPYLWAHSRKPGGKLDPPLGKTGANGAHRGGNVHRGLSNSNTTNAHNCP